MTLRRGFRSRAGGAAARGFSMIEVLISLVVLGLGLLGFALLQTMNLRYTQSANHRTQATNLAYDLLDQMRANRLSAAQYATATFAPSTVVGTGCSRYLNTVTVAQSVTRWKCQVVESLGPESSATVTYAAGVANVALTWGERVPGGATTFEVRTQL